MTPEQIADRKTSLLQELETRLNSAVARIRAALADAPETSEAGE